MEKHHDLKKIVWAIVPYAYFIGLAAFWFVLEMAVNKDFSYAALGIILILIIQAIMQNKIFGISLGIFAIAVHTISFLAVLSEFIEFKAISGDAIQLIAVGSLLSICGTAMGAIMAKANLKKLAMGRITVVNDAKTV